MKAIEFLDFLEIIPSMPWGIGVFSGRVLLATSREREASIEYGCKPLDIEKKYLVIWDRVLFDSFLLKMPDYDLLIKDKSCRKYAWELE